MRSRAVIHIERLWARVARARPWVPDRAAHPSCTSAIVTSFASRSLHAPELSRSLLTSPAATAEARAATPRAPIAAAVRRGAFPLAVDAVATLPESACAFPSPSTASALPGESGSPTASAPPAVYSPCAAVGLRAPWTLPPAGFPRIAASACATLAGSGAAVDDGRRTVADGLGAVADGLSTVADGSRTVADRPINSRNRCPPVEDKGLRWALVDWERCRAVHGGRTERERLARKDKVSGFRVYANQGLGSQLGVGEVYEEKKDWAWSFKTSRRSIEGTWVVGAAQGTKDGAWGFGSVGWWTHEAWVQGWREGTIIAHMQWHMHAHKVHRRIMNKRVMHRCSSAHGERIHVYPGDDRCDMERRSICCPAFIDTLRQYGSTESRQSYTDTYSPYFSRDTRRSDSLHVGRRYMHSDRTSGRESLNGSSSSSSSMSSSENSSSIQSSSTERSGGSISSSTSSNSVCSPESSSSSSRGKRGWREREVLQPANLVSLVRLASGPPIAALIVYNHTEAAVVALLLAGASDWLDGYLARRFKGGESVLGSYLDPLADKALVACVALALLGKGLLPPWLAVLVLARDVFLFGGHVVMRLNAVQWKWWQHRAHFFNIQKGTAERVEPLLISKVNTCLQMLLLPAALLHDPYLLSTAPNLLPYLCYSVATTTVTSWAAYMWVGLMRK